MNWFSHIVQTFEPVLHHVATHASSAIAPRFGFPPESAFAATKLLMHAHAGDALARAKIARLSQNPNMRAYLLEVARHLREHPNYGAFRAHADDRHEWAPLPPPGDAEVRGPVEPPPDEPRHHRHPRDDGFREHGEPPYEGMRARHPHHPHHDGLREHGEPPYEGMRAHHPHHPHHDGFREHGEPPYEGMRARHPHAFRGSQDPRHPWPRYDSADLQAYGGPQYPWAPHDSSWSHGYGAPPHYWPPPPPGVAMFPAHGGHPYGWVTPHGYPALPPVASFAPQYAPLPPHGYATFRGHDAPYYGPPPPPAFLPGSPPPRFASSAPPPPPVPSAPAPPGAYGPVASHPRASGLTTHSSWSAGASEVGRAQIVGESAGRSQIVSGDELAGADAHCVGHAPHPHYQHRPGDGAQAFGVEWLLEEQDALERLISPNDREPEAWRTPQAPDGTPGI